MRRPLRGHGKLHFHDLPPFWSYINTGTGAWVNCMNQASPFWTVSEEFNEIYAADLYGYFLLPYDTCLGVVWNAGYILWSAA